MADDQQSAFGDEVVIRLRFLKSDRPKATRLRQLLKHALRAQQLRCVELGDPKPAPREEANKTIPKR